MYFLVGIFRVAFACVSRELDIFIFMPAVPIGVWGRHHHVPSRGFVSTRGDLSRGRPRGGSADVPSDNVQHNLSYEPLDSIHMKNNKGHEDQTRKPIGPQEKLLDGSSLRDYSSLPIDLQHTCQCRPCPSK